MPNVLVTGGLGFIGSHMTKFLISRPDFASTVLNLDYIGYGSHFNNMEKSTGDNSRYIFVREDINNIERIASIRDVDLIVNIAAETHVDRSINTPYDFVHSNYEGTFALLEYARKKDINRYIQVSTDEVYGEAVGDFSFKESDALNPTNPYSSTKAAADLLVNSYFKTYGLRTSITRCTNNFGSNQFPEKLIPRTIIRILLGLPVLLYGNGKQVRDWLYVSDHISAIDLVIRNGLPGQIYNISASNYITNLDLVKKISLLVNEKKGMSANIEFVEDRPGHDQRYSLDSTRIRKDLGWKPEANMDDALEETVGWYLSNSSWWKNLVYPFVTEPPPWRNKKDD